jgi:hypothetical protein
VPLEFTFEGSFFNLADFFHDLKRYVHISDNGVAIKGRLMTIDSMTLSPTDFPQISAQVSATVFLSPKGEGVTAGATPQGPAETAATGTTTVAAPGTQGETNPTAAASAR